MSENTTQQSSAKVPVAARAHQPRPYDMQDGYHVLSYLIAGPLLYGGLGWLGDRYWETSWLLPVGLIVGLVLAIYMIVNRFGKVSE